MLKDSLNGESFLFKKTEPDFPDSVTNRRNLIQIFLPLVKTFLRDRFGRFFTLSFQPLDSGIGLGTLTGSNGGIMLPVPGIIPGIPSIADE